jgi:hypothetical protein
MKAMQLVTGYVTAPSSTFTALTMASGDTLSVRAMDGGKAYMLAFWSDQQTAGNVSIRSAQMHDNVQGIRAYSIASEVNPLNPLGAPIQLTEFDTLIIDMTGSATSADIETFSSLWYYDNAKGFAARLVTWDQIKSQVIDYMYGENTLSLGTGAGYSGEETIIVEFDQWKTQYDYALIGYLVSAECAAVGWRGPDTSNLRVGGPGNETAKEITRGWFKDLSQMTGLATIPVFYGQNKGSILVDGAQDENGTDSTVTSIFARLPAQRSV